MARELEIDDGIIHLFCIFDALKGLNKAPKKPRKTKKNGDIVYTADYSNLKDTIRSVFNLDDEKKCIVCKKLI